MPKAREPVAPYQATPTRSTSRLASTVPESTAKLFANGRSQAVRLPKEFRMPGNEVRIRREGPRIILEPMPVVPCDANGWPIGFWEEIDRLSVGLPDDFEIPDDPVPEPISAFDD